MNILIKPISNSIYKKNKFFEIDNGDNIFFGFKNKLEKLGITINTLDLKGKEDADCIIFCDMPLFWEIDYIKELLFSKNKKILFCFEPPVINPLEHRKFFYRFFNCVYTWNDKFIDNKKVRKFHLPVLSSNLNFKKVPFKNKKLLCLLNSNKSVPFLFLLLSPQRQVLYSERLRAINFFEKEIPLDFDLFGRGWNKPMKFSLKEKVFGYKTYASFKGAIPRNLDAKLHTLSKYKFNLCFENCVADGYISEKIIDCLKAHTIPIYLGTPNIDKYFPKDCYIDFREFKNYQALLKFIKDMDQQTYEHYVENGKKFLKSKEFLNQWTEEAFLKVFLNAI